MANRAKKQNIYNHRRQMWYLSHGVVMLPKNGTTQLVLRKNKRGKIYETMVRV